MDITVPGIAAPVSGTNPIVIIGPNGVGKTQLGVTVARTNNAERVAALRNVELTEIPLRRLEQASQDLKQVLNDMMNEHWKQSSELQTLMSEVVAEDRETLVKFRDDWEKDPTLKPGDTLINTRLKRIIRIWNRHFPGRRIKLDYQPMVDREKNQTIVTYAIARMSEGERTALYLAARVISCKTKAMLVDEPETFFHPLLARNLWNDLETEAPGIRFIYITHDIPFALSRRNARFVIARSETSAELLESTSAIPSDVIAEVLGAASFSISASRLIFCEGDTKSLDAPVLSAWHACPKTAVVPVGSCNAVRECVSVFRAQKVTTGVEAFGYIDRDGWPDALLSSEQHVKAHPVSEIEGLFCLEAVFKALAKYNGADDAGAQAQFNAFSVEARGMFKGGALNKEILERAKKRTETEQKALLNPIKPNPDLATMRKAFTAAEPPGGWPNYLSTVFAEEEARMNASLSGGASDFVRDFPAKSYVNAAARHLKFVEEKMVQTFCNALRLSDEAAKTDQKLAMLRDALVPAITPFMWPRKA